MKVGGDPWVARVGAVDGVERREMPGKTCVEESRGGAQERRSACDVLSVRSPVKGSG